MSVCDGTKYGTSELSSELGYKNRPAYRPRRAVVRRTRLRQVVPYLVSLQGLVCLRSFSSTLSTRRRTWPHVSFLKEIVRVRVATDARGRGGWSKVRQSSAAADQQSQQDERQLPCRLHADSDEVNLPKGRCCVWFSLSCPFSSSADHASVGTSGKPG